MALTTKREVLEFLARWTPSSPLQNNWAAVAPDDGVLSSAELTLVLLVLVFLLVLVLLPFLSFCELL